MNWQATVQGITRVRHDLALSFFFSNKHQGFPGGSVVKNLPANAEGTGDVGLIPGSGRSPGGGHGNPLQYSRLENFMDRGVWWVQSMGLQKSQTRLSD